MKKFQKVGVIFLSILFLFGCQGEYYFEDSTLACIRSGFAENDLSVEEIIDSTEQLLLQDGILSSGSDSSYLALIDTMSQISGYFQINIETEQILFDSFYNDFYGNVICAKSGSFDTTGFAESKLNRVFEHFQSSMTLMPDKYFAGLRDILTLADMRHPFYKLLVLSEFANTFVFPRPTSCMGSRLWRMRQPYEEEFPPDSLHFQDTIRFFMDSYIATFINDELTAPEEIPETVKNILLSNHAHASRMKQIDLIGQIRVSQTLIQMEYEFGTSRNSFADLDELIAQGFDLARNDISRSIFSEEYTDLDQEKKFAINEVIPLYFVRI